MKKLLLLIAIVGMIFLGSCASNGLSAKKFTVSDEFVEYIKSRTNPYEWGLREDGRFYPYSSPRGRLIGYGQGVSDEKYYSDGWAKEDAEKQLREDLGETLEQLREHLAKEYPSRSFDALPDKCRQILLDFAHSEGVKNLKPEFSQTVIDQDWQKFFDSDMYIRWEEKGWTDKVTNKVFADKWIEPKSRLKPF